MKDNAEKNSLGPNHDTSSSNLSAPPGFEHGRETSSGNTMNIPERVRGRSRERKRGRKKQSRKTSLKLIEQVKERARRKKEEHKKKIGKQKQARVTEIEDDATKGGIRGRCQKIPKIEGRGSEGDRKGSEKKRAPSPKRKYEAKMVGLETKACMVKDYEIKRMWGNTKFQWEAVIAINNSGGLIWFWDTDFFEVQQVVKGKRWICLKGIIKELSLLDIIVMKEDMLYAGWVKILEMCLWERQN
ncbi:hypothetical protein PIB30_060101 [Stylosanthes scabra]|uniref:Uncharacterized protein n=1 Tax=Stylosanthes scabra TaxID=79078 RepID=A0ABU6RLA4_9FABA|nr:hypothetical protein [Stylosanthes scabra]